MNHREEEGRIEGQSSVTRNQTCQSKLRSNKGRKGGKRKNEWLPVGQTKKRRLQGESCREHLKGRIFCCFAKNWFSWGLFSHWGRLIGCSNVLIQSHPWKPFVLLKCTQNGGKVFRLPSKYMERVTRHSVHTLGSHPLQVYKLVASLSHSRLHSSLVLCSVAWSLIDLKWKCVIDVHIMCPPQKQAPVWDPNPTPTPTCHQCWAQYLQLSKERS